jgi:hypothetical protein
MSLVLRACRDPIVENRVENQVSVVELRRMMGRGDVAQDAVFRKVLERCFRHIRNAASIKSYTCVFEVPVCSKPKSNTSSPRNGM